MAAAHGPAASCDGRSLITFNSRGTKVLAAAASIIQLLNVLPARDFCGTADHETLSIPRLAQRLDRGNFYVRISSPAACIPTFSLRSGTSIRPRPRMTEKAWAK